DITGAIGCSRLDRLAAQTTQRQKNAARYDRIIQNIDGLSTPVTTPGAEAVYHLYVLQMDTEAFTCTRDEFAAALKAEGVPTAVHYPRPLTRQPAFAAYADAKLQKSVPVSERLSQRVLALPMHHDLSDEHFRIVGEALSRVAEAYRA